MIKQHFLRTHPEWVTDYFEGMNHESYCRSEMMLIIHWWSYRIVSYRIVGNLCCLSNRAIELATSEMVICASWLWITHSFATVGNCSTLWLYGPIAPFTERSLAPFRFLRFVGTGVERGTIYLLVSGPRSLWGRKYPNTNATADAVDF